MAEKRGHVTGLGGIFVKSGNTEELAKWYQEKLGFPFDGYGSNFIFREDEKPAQRGYSVWGPFKDDTTYFEPSKKEFMINLRVKGLRDLLDHLKTQGVQQIGDIEEHDYGHFAWIIDPEGTKIELWEQVGDVPTIDSDSSTK